MMSLTDVAAGKMMPAAEAQDRWAAAGIGDGRVRRSVHLVLLVALGVPALAAGQTGAAVTIPLHTPDSDYYPWITQLSVGRVQWSQSPEDAIRGRRYRAAVLTSEIFSTLIIELISLGTEGCCAQLIWSRRFDMEVFRQAFQLKPELAGLVVDAWPTGHSFEFTIQRRHFLATIAEGPTLTIEER